jgi:hypothetical protein
MPRRGSFPCHAEVVATPPSANRTSGVERLPMCSVRMRAPQHRAAGQPLAAPAGSRPSQVRPPRPDRRRCRSRRGSRNAWFGPLSLADGRTNNGRRAGRAGENSGQSVHVRRALICIVAGLHGGSPVEAPLARRRPLDASRLSREYLRPALAGRDHQAVSPVP